MAKTCADGDPIWIEIPATGDSEELKVRSCYLHLWLALLTRPLQSFYQGIFPKWKFHASQPDAHVSGYEVAKGKPAARKQDLCIAQKTLRFDWRHREDATRL